MAKDKYEISLWEDVFVEASGGVPSHYEEEKIAIIGSDTMTTQCRAIEPKLVCNVNGKVTFTFKMYLRYHDELTGEDYDNPFLNLLVNERKVKVYWNKIWYDLVIKNIQESSNGKTVVYSCEDANINELAKTGFDLVFDDDLSLNTSAEGNQGTVQELVARTIEGTDWQIGDNDTIQQYVEEPVYEVTVTGQLSIKNMNTAVVEQVPAGNKILVFYPQLADYINNSSSVPTLTFNPFYMAYDPEQNYNRYAKTEMLVQADCYAYGTYGVSTCTCTISNNILTFSHESSGDFGSININNISTRYRANRLVSQPLTKIEPITGLNCYVYKAITDGTGNYAGKIYQNDIVYESISTEFGDALTATNLIANGTAFKDLSGWEGPSNYPLTLTIYPNASASDVSTSKVYLTLYNLNSPAAPSQYYYNDAIRVNSNYFKDGCMQGEVYRLRVKGLNHDYTAMTEFNVGFEPKVLQWDNTGGPRQPSETNLTSYFNVAAAASDSDGWVYFDMTCKESFSGSDIYKDHIGLFLMQYGQWAKRYIEEIQFFKVVKVKDSQGHDKVLLPTDLDATGIINTTYTYFLIRNGKVKYLYNGVTDWNKNGVSLEQQYNTNYAKIRSINIKQSNRFNILQTIAETFECWIRFNVLHDSSTGKLIYNNGVPQKFITIKQDMGTERGFGFVYGIDLQSIQRTIESNQIVTKTIVLENNNSVGKNGTCRISRAASNYPQTDYILNFDYYINHELIDPTELNRDLYGRIGDQTNTYAFYYNLHQWNSEYAKLAEENANYEIALNKNEGYKTAYQTAKDGAAEEAENHKKQVVALAGTKKPYNSNEVRTYIKNNIDTNVDLKAHVAAIKAQTQLVEYYNTQIVNINTVIDSYTNKISTNQTTMDQLMSFIKQKTKLFNKKYARFISEGSWIDQKYYDDNLYYLDANSVAYTSSRPKVSYNVSVIRVTGIEGFELKDFALGDITYIEDKDFFGYIKVDGIKTPYREKVVITEVTYNFDEPDKDTFKVQNYRTQFEDLFQRIAAQTQSLQYSVGAYAKVSDIINSDSTIKGGLLKKSMEANEDALNRSSLNNSVVTNEQGITVSNLLNSANAVRVTSGGLFITTDGGDTWKNAIHGDGIGTEYLTSGAIDTHRIQIFGDSGTDSSAIAFKWDKDGLNAYDKDSDAVQSSDTYAYDPLKFVRFNSKGITVQEATGRVVDSTARTTYEKLKLGQLEKKANGEYEYGLKINTLVNASTGATETAFAATETGLFVRGDIQATGLTLVGNTVFDVDAGKMSINGESILNWTQDQFTSQISSLSIGTRNYIRNLDNENAATRLCTFSYDRSNGTYVLTATERGSDQGYCQLWLGSNGFYSIESIQSKKCKFHVNSIERLTNLNLSPRVFLAFFDNDKNQISTSDYLTIGELSKQITIPSNAKYMQPVIRVDQNKAEATGDKIRVRGLMLEVSSNDSDWVPAHEDEEAYTATQINQTNEEISLWAEKTSPAINLLQNSGTFDDWSYTASQSGVDLVTFFASTTSGYEGCTIAGFPAGTFSTSTGHRYVCSNKSTTLIPLRKLLGRTITVSCMMQTDKPGLVSDVVINLELCSSSGSNRTHWRTVLSLADELTSSFKQYKATVTIPDFNNLSNFFTNGTGDFSLTDGVSLACRISNANTGARFYFMTPQIEYGSEATPWKESQGDTLSSQILVQAGEISLKVSSSEYTDDKVLGKVNASSLTINPDRISLEGKNIQLNAGDGITITSPNFEVDSSGTITSKAGNIGGWTINSTSLTKKTADTGGYTVGINAPSSVTPSVNRVFYVDDDTAGATDSRPFYVRYDGLLHASKAIITGNITATSLSLTSDGSGVSIGNTPASGVTGLTINSNGLLTASNAVIYGNIYAGGGIIGGWDINSRSLSKTTNGGYTVGISAPSNPSSSAGTVNRAFYVDNNSGSTVFSVYYDGRIVATKGTIGKCTIDANGNLQVPAAHISGQLTAGQINGENLVISGTGKFGVFQIGNIQTDADTATFSGMAGGNIKINTQSIQAPNLYGDWIKAKNTLVISGNLILNNANVAPGTYIPYWNRINIAQVDTSGTASYTTLRNKINEIILAINGLIIRGAE